MDGSGNIQRTIKGFCSNAVQNYQQCMLKLTSDGTYRLLKIEYDRLRIWAGNIGVYGRPPASADDRLAEDDEVRNIVIELLSDLSIRLQKYTVLDNEKQIDEQSAESDTTLSSSDDDDHNQDGKGRSVIGSTDSRLLHFVRRVTSQLFSVLALVTQPTNLSSNEKVFSHDFQSKLRSDYESLILDFEKFVDFYLRRAFRSAPPDERCTLPEELLIRIKNASIIRRKALLLKARHKRKLRGNIAVEFRELPIRVEQSTVQDPISVNLPHLTESVADSRSEATRTILSETVPSVAAQDLKAKTDRPDAQTLPKSAKSVVLLRSKLDVPQPPKLEQYHSEVDCYICGLNLDRALLQEDRWKKHVLEDIDPFVCLFECSKPDTLYKTPEEWYNHMRTHRMQWCCMTPAHRNLMFDSEADLKGHLLSAHAFNLSKAQIDVLLKRGRRVLPRLFDDCPLCGKSVTELSPANEDEQSSVKALHRHIESHMYEIALLSIPPYPGLVAISQSDAVNESSGANAISQIEDDLAEEVPGLLTHEIEDPEQYDSTILSSLEAPPHGQNLDSLVDVSKKEHDRDRRVDDVQEQEATAEIESPHQRDSDESDSAEYTEMKALAERNFRVAEYSARRYSLAEGRIKTLQAKLADMTLDHMMNQDAQDVWTEICKTISNVKARENDEVSDRTLRAHFQSRNAQKERCPDAARLYFSIGEHLCTNRQIYRAINQEAIDLVDITIVPRSTTMDRTVTLFYKSPEAAALTLAGPSGLQGLNINGISISVLPAQTKSAPNAVPSRSRYSSSQSLKDYQIAWLCVRQEDLMIASEMLDEEYDDQLDIDTVDDNVYKLGRVQENNVVIVRRHLRDHGGKSMTMTVTEMLRTFKDIRLCLMVGTGDGIPNLDLGRDIRLGDVVVGVPSKLHGGVILLKDGRKSSLVPFEVHGRSKAVPRPILATLMELWSQNEAAQRNSFEVLSKILESSSSEKSPWVVEWFKYPGSYWDVLHCSHVSDDRGFSSCPSCQDGTIDRASRSDADAVLHCGTIVSGKFALESATLRDTIGQKFNALCFETDADEVINDLPCLVIRGIAGYADAFKDRMWLNYAAATAAAFAKTLLERIGPVTALSPLVDSMEDRYAQIFEVILSHDRLSDILKILSWLCYSYRPLLVEELADVLADGGRDYSGRRSIREESVRNLREPIALCYPLLVFPSTNDNIDPSKVPGGVAPVMSALNSGAKILVQFASDLVKEYLLSDRCPLRNSLRSHDCHVQITGHCLIYLRNLSSEPALTSEALRMYPLSDYAAEFWWQHAQLAERSLNTWEIDGICAFLTTSDTLGTWISLYNIDNPSRGQDLLYRSNVHFVPTLYYAASIGIPEVTKRFVEQGADVNSPGGHYGNALQAAAWYGYEETVKILLAAGADLHAQGGCYRNALSAASAGGHSAIVELLIAKGANVNTGGADGQHVTPLRVAASRGHLAVVELLLDKGADIDDVGGINDTPLQAASAEGYLDVVDLLISRGAGTNFEDFETSLHAASVAGHLAVVKSLVRHGAHVNDSSMFWRSSLYGACSEGQLDIVRYLINCGANINEGHPRLRGSPLHAASCKGRLDVVRLLLDLGANVNDGDPTQDSSLHGASSNGQLDVVRLLLDSGADVKDGLRFRETPLHAASAKGYLAIVKVLIEHGADINDGGRLHLHAASSKDHLDFVTLLLDERAKFNNSGKIHESPLHPASSNGHLDVCRLLIDHGADVNIKDVRYGTPLRLASRNGHLAVVKLLIDSNADLEVGTEMDGTALHAALSKGHKEIADILRKAGAKA